MRKIIFLLLFLIGSLEAKIPALVSIAPQKYILERIGGDQVTVNVLVPPGISSHSYEPSPKQMLVTQKAEIWFRLGESFETKIIPSLGSKVLIFDQRDGIELIDSSCPCQDSFDPHIWLSPRLLKKQATQMAYVLMHHDPEHAEMYEINLKILLNELEKLDQELKRTLMTKKTILVSHPAFGYFCHDYGLQQLSIETEGREPTPKYLVNLILKAKIEKIHTVFLQQQHNVKGGKRVAKELGAETVFIDPYKENVIDNLRTIATYFSQS